MDKEELLRKLEGLHTAETVAEELSIKRQSALNLISTLKREGYITTKGRKKRIYKITMRKQRPRKPGMFDIINKHSPMKLQPWFDHQVHGTYGPEEALVDALHTESFRVILASMRLFNHITNWPKLYRLAQEKECWQKVGALYDVAKLFFKVKKIPKRYKKIKSKGKEYLIKTYPTKDERFLLIEKEWNVAIPFRVGDIQKVAG